MITLATLLAASQSRHSHLCPRQVLGVRIALSGLRFLDINPADRRKKLLVISETYGCFVDGIEVTAQVSVGHRSLRIEDYGKIAATFVHLKTGRAVRLYPKAGLRQLARKYSPVERRAYFAQLEAYQFIPDDELLVTEWVTLKQDIKQIMGLPGQRTCCGRCGEEIINGREIIRDEIRMCISCAGHAYYQPVKDLGMVEHAISG